MIEQGLSTPDGKGGDQDVSPTLRGRLDRHLELSLHVVGRGRMSPTSIGRLHQHEIDRPVVAPARVEVTKDRRSGVFEVAGDDDSTLCGDDLDARRPEDVPCLAKGDTKLRPVDWPTPRVVLYRSR